MTTKYLFRLTGTTLAFSAALILSTGCARNSAQNASPPPSVTVAPVEQRQLVEWDVFTGRTEAVEFVEVRPRVSGHVQEARFQSGQLVKNGEREAGRTGQLLANKAISTEEAEARESRFQEAKAALLAAEAARDSAK